MSDNGTSAPASGSRDMERANEEARRSEAARRSRGPCPSCDGEGSYWDLYYGQWCIVPCSQCQGTGRVNTNYTEPKST